MFDTATGDITRVKSLWVSHSFDQRLLYDASGFVELHLGDAYPRTIVFGRSTAKKVSKAFTLMHVKGASGANNTYTRLGNFVRSTSMSQAGVYDYLGIVATERTTETKLLSGAKKVAGARDLALFRVARGFEQLAPGDMSGYIDTQGAEAVALESKGKQKTNHIRWLTRYGQDGMTEHYAERPKLVALASGKVLVLWERWSIKSFIGTYGMLLDAAGEVLVEETMLSESHLPRGDDAIAWGAGAVWVTGDEKKRQLWVHLVDESLAYQRVVID
jgi:hypothetical protein